MSQLIPNERLEEVRATLRACLDAATVWPDLSPAQDADFDTLVVEWLAGQDLGSPGHYYDRQRLAHVLLHGAAIGLLPAKPAALWVSLMTNRALQWIEQAPPAGSSAESLSTETALGSQVA